MTFIYKTSHFEDIMEEKSTISVVATCMKYLELNEKRNICNLKKSH